MMLHYVSQVLVKETEPCGKTGRIEMPTGEDQWKVGLFISGSALPNRSTIIFEKAFHVLVSQIMLVKVQT